MFTRPSSAAAMSSPLPGWIGMSVVCAVVVSLLPAWHATRRDVSGAIKRDTDTSPRATATRGVLVSAQIALSLVLLVGAGLMGRAFVSLRAVTLGFDPHRVVTANVALNFGQFGRSDPEARVKRLAFYHRLSDAVAKLPGVQRSGVGWPTPLSRQGTLTQQYSLSPEDTRRQAEAVLVLAGYFEALRVPLVAGRYFTRADDDQPVVILDEQLAMQLWPGQSALGRRLLLFHTPGEPQWEEIVGVTRLVQNQEPAEGGLPQIWVTYATQPGGELDLAVRASNPAALVPALRDTVQRLGAGRPLHDIRLLDDLVVDATTDTRFALFVLGAFAALALLLTAVGVYGVVAYATARRTREIAVRLALGADARGLVALIIREGAGWTLLGLAGGLGGAFALSS
jgi:predicted permease